MSDFRELIEQALDNTRFHSMRKAIAEELWVVAGPRWDRMCDRVRELEEYEIGLKHLTVEDGAIEMSLHMAHNMMRAFVAAFIKLLQDEGGPNYVEMSFKLAGSLDRYVVTIRQPDGMTPADVASEWRARAEQAVRLVEVAATILQAGDHGTTEGETWGSWKQDVEKFMLTDPLRAPGETLQEGTS